jgi:hypothetical protein
MTHTAAVDWDFLRIAEAFNAPEPNDPRHREIVRRQQLDDRRTFQATRLRAQRDVAGMPHDEPARLMARSERLLAKVTYDVVRNNPVISDPRLAEAVWRASTHYGRAAWAVVNRFFRSRIPPSRALVALPAAPATPPRRPKGLLDQPIPRDRGVFILVRSGRAIVSRYRQSSARGAYDVQHARNWQALEREALDAVEAAGGAWWADDHYPCPPALAARAVFDA